MNSSTSSPMDRWVCCGHPLNGPHALGCIYTRYGTVEDLLTSTRQATRRAALIEAAEMCEGEARAWEVVGLLDYARPLTAMAARLRASADQPTTPAGGRDG